MKLCDVTQFYAPGSGGVKRYLTQKRRYLLEETPAAHTLIIPGERTEWTGESRARTCTIASPVVEHVAGYRLLWKTNAVQTALAEAKPDLIEVADPYQLAWTALQVGRARGVPVVGFYHSDVPRTLADLIQRWLGAGCGRFVERIARRYVVGLYSRFARTLVASDVVAERLRAWGVRNVAVTPFGVDTKIFAPNPPDPSVRAKLGIPADALLLLFVGRLSLEKNLPTLLRTFELLTQGFPNSSVRPWHLLVVGDGPLRKLVEPASKAQRHLHWLPRVEDPSALADLYRAADLFIHPGLNETFGLVLLEAQACGVPVLGFAESSLTELCFAGREGWAREVTPQALAAAIDAASELDLPSLGAQAAHVVRERFDEQQSFARLWEEYRAVLTEFASRPPKPR